MIIELTARERQVLQLLWAGKQRKEIAHELGISVDAIDDYRGSVGRKLDAQGTVMLIRKALNLRLIALP